MFHYGKDHLTAGKALAILHGALNAQIAEDTRTKIQGCYEAVVDIAGDHQAVYGINTGFGPLCNTKISPDETRELQRKILLSHSVGVGEPVTADIAKLMLILKVHALAKGYSGIHTEVLDRMIWHISNDVTPVVPAQGSVGASGDLAPLAHLFLPLIGEGQVRYQGQTRPAADILQQHDLAPLQLGPKAGLALINGTQFIAAHAVMVVDQLHNCLAHADLIGALMIEGLQGSRRPFHEALHQTRPYPGNRHVAHRIDALLRDSAIMEAHADCDRVQDPYSLRCIPQVHGASRTAWLHLKELLEIELNAVTDNPVVFNRDFTISGGNFHGQPLALPLDYACLAAAELGNISDRRSYLSLEGKHGLPKLLMEETGVNSGFMLLQYTAAALVSENKGLCFPASADSIPTSLGQEDHVSMGSIGGRKALRVCENLRRILAIELLCAAQALDFRRPLRSSESLEALHAHIRQYITFAEEDRIFAEDINRAAELIGSKELLGVSKRYLRDEEVVFERF
ncbi:MAG: histidine ammonia-lyase [Bacteroidota bacterium]